MRVHLFYFLLHLTCLRGWPDVTIKQGTLRGAEFVSRGGKKFYSFLSIPYAKPPLGELRFQEPQPPAGWKGIFNATTESPTCLQKQRLILSAGNKTFGQEDCLYLNVYTPYARHAYTKKNLPVMVWIFGGAYHQGNAASNTYGPFYLMDRDVVYVSFNYRVASFGFLSSESTILPGNYGLKDQQFALRWVKDNIEAFGGDAQSITIFGESSGAASVHLQLVAPKSQGLFHRAIMESGCAFNPWSLMPQGLSKSTFHTYAKRLNCNGDENTIVACLRKVSGDQILAVETSFVEWSFDPLRSFGPVIEPSHPGAFITKHPLQYKTSASIPVIMGVNHDEGAFKTARLCSNNLRELKQLNQNWYHYLPLSLLLTEYVEPKDLNQVVQNLTNFYLKGQKVTRTNLGSLSKMYTDMIFVHGVVKAAQYMSGPVYFYLYNHLNKLSWTSGFGNCKESLGVCHGDEMISLFNLDAAFGNHSLTGIDLTVSHTLLQLWTNFATTGVPRDDAKKINWPRYDSKTTRECLAIGNFGAITTDWFDARYRFIESLPLAFKKLERSLKP